VPWLMKEKKLNEKKSDELNKSTKKKIRDEL
jgi:hypothetical protein